MSTFSGRERGLAALTPDLVLHGEGLDSAVNGMIDAVNAVTYMATAPGKAARAEFRAAVLRARASADNVYSAAFARAAWQTIDGLRRAAGGA